MSREIDLQEYKACGPFPFSLAERDALSAALPSVTIEPATGMEGHYYLTAGSTVGAIEIGDLSVLIQPKIGIPQLLSLACYAIGAYRQQDDRLFDFGERVTLPDALALALGNAARRAFTRGLLHGYRAKEEALQTVRGRIRFADQVRSRYGIAPPIEVRYNEFTDDILENRLVKAAAHKIGRLFLRSPHARRGLGWIAGMLDNVSYVEFWPRSVPPVTPSRINDHYSDVIALSRLILRHGAFESERGEIRASGFLMDMNVVFQEFVTTALTEQLRDAPGVLRSDKELTGDRQVFLDADRHIRLEPDLTWWRGRQMHCSSAMPSTRTWRTAPPGTPIFTNFWPMRRPWICRVERSSMHKVRLSHARTPSTTLASGCQWLPWTFHSRLRTCLRRCGILHVD